MPDEGSSSRNRAGRSRFELTLLLRDSAWNRALPDPELLVRKALAAVLDPRLSGEDEARQIAVVLADDAFVQGLNARFRGKDKPTNVLSFPSPSGAGELGDVVLAFETVEAEARAEGKPLADHTAHLVIHGALHLVGHTHDEDREAEKMMAAEIAALSSLGIADPYPARAVEEALS